MRTKPLFFVATLATAFAAEPPEKIVVAERSVAEVKQVVTGSVVAPAGQTFSRPESTFSPAIPPEIPVKGGTFSRPGPTFSTPAGSFARPATTFSTPAGSFSRPESTFANPLRATSPLPLGAYGAPIRPVSTFNLPPGAVITREQPVAIIQDAGIIATEQTITAGSEVFTEPAVESVSPAVEAALPAADLTVIDLPPGARIRKVVPQVVPVEALKK